MNKKQLICFLLAFALTLGVFLCPNNSKSAVVSAADDIVDLKASDLIYDVYSDNGISTVTITGYTGSHKKIRVPEAINGAAVTYIEHSAFGDNSTIEYIELPASVEYISEGAFDSATAITEYAISPNNKYYTTENGVLYSKDKTFLLAYPAARGGTFTVPKSVEIIGSLAFYKAYKLTSVKMYNNVKSIDAFAFALCWNLTSVKLSDNLQTLGYRAFYGCQSLAEIHLPYSLQSISEQALLGGIDSKDNMYYHTTKGIYFVKGSYAEGYVKKLHLPSQYLKTETRTVTDVASNITLYDSANVFPKTGTVDIKVTIQPNTSYTALLPVRYSKMFAYTISFVHNGKEVSLSSPCVVRFNGFPAGTIATATKVYTLRSGSLIEKTRDPKAAFIGTSFSAKETLVVITNNNFSLKGDIDGDGTRSVYDVRIALSAASKLVSLTSAQATTANIDGKGEITSADALEILRYAAGIKK